MAHLKRWNGKQWVDSGIGGLFKKFDGKKWVNATIKRWNGKAWENISLQTYTKTFNTTWTRSYGGDNRVKWNDVQEGRLLFQGRYSNPDIQWEGDWGIQKSMCGFDDASIRSNLSNAKINKVELYLENAHWWYWAGGMANIGAHNSSNPPSVFAPTKNSIKSEQWTRRGGGRWITLPNSFGEDLRDGRAKGFTLYRNTTDPYYYGYFYGQNGGNKAPKLKITYTK